MKIVSYTAICGEAYEKKFPDRADIDWCFRSSGMFTRPEMEAERYKLLGHQFFSDAHVLIWMDGNIRLKWTPEELVERFLGTADVAIFKHPERDCLFDEIEVMKGMDRFKNDQFLMEAMDAQARDYRAAGMPEHFGLWETGIILRRTYSRVNLFFNSWWAELCRYHWRNQSSLPWVYAREKNFYGINFRTIDQGDLRVHPALEFNRY
jgi:hypothetical protein